MAVFSAALVFSGLAASAATISNRDDKDQKLIIIEGETKKDEVLKPKQALEKICLKGCIIQLNGSDDDEYQIDPEDVVSIEDGYLYHDAPDQPAPPPAEKPSAPVKQ